METEEIIIQLEHTLPPLIARAELGNLLPGLVSPKTVSNKNSAGEGPPTFKMGRKIFYERSSFLEWLSKRITKHVVI